MAFDFSVGKANIAPEQVRSEIADLLRLVSPRSPRRILEIGTARGGTLFLFSQVAADDALLLSIDLPGGEFGVGGGLRWIPLLKALRRHEQKLRLVRGDSHVARTRRAVERWFQAQPLDIIFIDGDHRYQGVQLDFQMYGTLVRPGGLIAIHDIVPGSPDVVGGVPDFWQAIKRRFITYEFVKDWDQGGWGIGVVEVPAEGIGAIRERTT